MTEASIIGSTINNGEYVVVEQLKEGGTQRLFRGISASRPEQQALITSLWAPKGLPIAELTGQFAPQTSGVFAMSGLRHFDPPKGGKERDVWWDHNVALVERVGQGVWLPRLTARGIGPRKAMLLGISVGRILQEASQHGQYVYGVCPEYIWVHPQEGGTLTASGLSDRYRVLFEHTTRGSTPGALLERTYLPPEILRQEKGTATSLTFSLAIMIAEWVQGEYPFPLAWAQGDLYSLKHGEHAPLSAPSSLAHLLHLGMSPEPTDRPSLPAFLTGLEAIAEETPMV